MAFPGISRAYDSHFVASAVAVLHGHGNRTGFAAVSTVPGGATITFDGDRFATVQQWTPPMFSSEWADEPSDHAGDHLRHLLEDAVFELGFPSPYLNHHPTALIERRSTGLAYRETHHRPSYAEGFVEEMRAFHAAITRDGPRLNTVEQAGADITLLAGLGRLGAAGPAAAA